MSLQHTSGLVSIIIPVYNVGPYLPRCLDSVLAQTYPHWEALCVDDGSTDDSGTILDAYAAKDARIRCIHQTNAGVSAARNAALDIMQGEYLTMLDSDDSIEPNMLEEMVRAMREYNVELVSCGYCQIDEQGKKRHFPALIGDKDYISRCVELTHDILYRVTSYNWTKLFRTDVWRKASIRYSVGCAYGEDHAVLMRYLMHAHCMVGIASPLYHYYRRSESASRAFEQKLRPAAVYIPSFRMLSTVVDYLPESASKDFRAMWHYVALRRFVRSMRALALGAHPESESLNREIMHDIYYLQHGLSWHYRLLWRKQLAGEYLQRLKIRLWHKTKGYIKNILGRA